MWKRRIRSLIGLDIGTKAVKAVELTWQRWTGHHGVRLRRAPVSRRRARHRGAALPGERVPHPARRDGRQRQVRHRPLPDDVQDEPGRPAQRDPLRGGQVHPVRRRGGRPRLPALRGPGPRRGRRRTRCASSSSPASARSSTSSCASSPAAACSPRSSTSTSFALGNAFETAVRLGRRGRQGPRARRRRRRQDERQRAARRRLALHARDPLRRRRLHRGDREPPRR